MPDPAPAPFSLGFGEPNPEAAAFIRNKPAVSRQVFERLLPELRARAFTITGIEGANILQRVRDEIATLPEGALWDDVKGNITQMLDEASFGDGAERRAELLIRTHGFQAYQAGQWDAGIANADTTHWQYLATEDDRVRPTHLALNGIILPKSDPFWQKHFPPWEWGCRCRVRAMNPDQVDDFKQQDETRPPEDRYVFDGPVAERLRNGQLQRGTRSFDVTAPSDRPGGETAFRWFPGDLHMPLEQLQAKYDQPVWQEFTEWASRTKIPETQRTVAAWLRLTPPSMPPPAPFPPAKAATTQGPALSSVPASGPALSRLPDRMEAINRLKKGFSVESAAGINVRFGRLLRQHLERSEDSQRPRFLPAAARAVADPGEIWEHNHRHYYLAKFLKKDQSLLGFIVVAARIGQEEDEAITFFPKTERELEKLRRGMLVFRKKAVA